MRSEWWEWLKPNNLKPRAGDLVQTAMYGSATISSNNIWIGSRKPFRVGIFAFSTFLRWLIVSVLGYRRLLEVPKILH